MPKPAKTDQSSPRAKSTMSAKTPAAVIPAPAAKTKLNLR